MEHGCCLLNIALADVREGQIPQDDGLGLVTALEAACGALQDRPCLGAVTEGKIARALYPSEAVGGQEAWAGSVVCMAWRCASAAPRAAAQYLGSASIASPSANCPKCVTAPAADLLTVA